jgi:hypothetical protein
MLPFAPALLTLALHIFFQHYLQNPIPFLHSTLYYPHLHRRITLHSCTLAPLHHTLRHSCITLFCTLTILSSSVAQPSSALLHHPVLHPCITLSCTLAPFLLRLTSSSPAHLHLSLLHYCTTISCSLALLSAVLMHHHLHPFHILPAPLHHSLIHASTILSCTLYPHCVHFEPFSDLLHLYTFYTLLSCNPIQSIN